MSDSPVHNFNIYYSGSKLYNINYNNPLYFNMYLPIDTYYWNLEVFKYFIPLPLEYYDAYILDEMAGATLRQLSFKEIT